MNSGDFIVQFKHAAFGWLTYEDENCNWLRFPTREAAQAWVKEHPSPYPRRIRDTTDPT